MLWLVVGVVYGFVLGWLLFGILCGLLGLFEVVVILLGMKVVVEWFFDCEKFVVVGYFNVGMLFGVVIVLLFVVFLLMWFGW